jgi:hypothetical protein
MPASRRPKPRKTKPGPVAYAPTSAERDRVEVAIAMGMTIDEISDEMEMPRSSFCRTFKREIAIGRNRKRLELAMHLYHAACSQNVSACKALMALFSRDDDARPAEVEDKWEKIAREIVDSVDGDTNLGRFQDFQKVN